MEREVLERTQWDFFWIPDDATAHDRPGLGYLSCPRPLEYLNTVYRIRETGTALAAAVEEVAQAHAGPSRYQLANTIELDPIERCIEAAGYVRGHEYIASVISPAEFVSRSRGAFRLVRVTARAPRRPSSPSRAFAMSAACTTGVGERSRPLF